VNDVSSPRADTRDVPPAAPAATASGPAPVSIPGPMPARKRTIALAVFGTVVVLGLGGYGAWWMAAGRWAQTTEDAYVAGNLVQLTPQVGGTVVAIRADDTDLVRAGQTVVELDRADAQIALDQAEAALAKTVRDVRALYSGTDQLRASVDVRESELARVRADLKRRLSLADSGAVSGEELEHARTAVAGAEAALAAAREQWQANLAQTEGTKVESHPLVRQAAARVREAYLAYSRAGIAAPVTGYVAKRAVQVGQRLQPGTPLLAIVPLDHLWVDANFKENQLRDLRIGQPVTLEADLYGSRVEYHGRVAGLAAGTGSVFSLLPAQNATGNWIKVVQRVPVRVELDPEELRKNPLRVGLSMRVKIGTRDRTGAMLAGSPRNEPRYEAATQDPALEAADRRVADIIRANGRANTRSAVQAAARLPAA
jgi:membrane fusion protein (multidrug efflux system)